MVYKSLTNVVTVVWDKQLCIALFVCNGWSRVGQQDIIGCRVLLHTCAGQPQ